MNEIQKLKESFTQIKKNYEIKGVIERAFPNISGIELERMFEKADNQEKKLILNRIEFEYYIEHYKKILSKPISADAIQKLKELYV